MNKYLYIFIRILSYLPFTQFIFKIFYGLVLNKLRDEFSGHEEVKDIILTSDTTSPDFIYGLSDLNFLIIVENEFHPKKVLTEFRDFISQHLLLKIIVHDKYLPILTEDEIKTDVIKSYLIRNSAGDMIEWKSIFTTKAYLFKLTEQDYFAISFSCVQTLDHYLLRSGHKKNKRIQFKNIYKALKGIERLHKKHFKTNRKWSMRYIKLHRFPFLLNALEGKLYYDTWKFLTTSDKKKQGLFNSDLSIPEEVRSYLKSIYTLPFIDNIVIIPSMIQNKRKDLKGKLYFDIVLNEKAQKKHKKLKKIRNDLYKLSSTRLKNRVRYTSTPLHLLQNAQALFYFPLETLYRNRKAFSIIGKNEEIIVSREAIYHSSIHFLVTQFMRFRSLEQKSDLIGSKFIKSLNLMYKYYLLNYYLKGNEVDFLGDQKIIRERLTPQFSAIKNNDTVTEEDWILIKAQLLYLLKGIRDELAKKDESLKTLRF